MDTNPIVTVNLENDEDTLSTSTLQNKTDIILGKNEIEVSSISNQINAETSNNSFEHIELTGVDVIEILSSSSQTVYDKPEKKSDENSNPHDAGTLEVPFTKVQERPVESNINGESSNKTCLVLTGDTQHRERNISMEDITTDPSSGQSRNNTTTEPLKNGYRCQDDSWSEDDETSSTSSDSSSDSDTFFEAMREGPAPKTTYPIMKTKGELDLDDLPLIEDLVISIEESEVEKIGKVYAVVEKLVIVRALKDSKPLDMDSVLFLSHDKPLGRVFDVFGQVMQPFYSIRFNSEEQIKERDIKVDADVFYAPQKNDITSYVFVDALQNQKGSDASWKHNNEPPEEYLDYSDDEQERAARRKRMVKHRNQSFNSSSDVATKRPSLAGDTPDRPIYIPPPRAAPRRNLHGSTSGYFRPNPFSVPRPILSPAPPTLQAFSVMSPAPSPYGIPQHNQIHLPFSVHSPPPPLPYQQPLQRHPQSPLVFATHQQPVFGQLSIMSPALHTPSPFQPTVIGNVPHLMPAAHLSPVNPQNYFNQRFPRNSSPALQNGSPMSPDPWLPNRAPYQQSNLPPNAPLSVQIPPNLSSPSLPVNPFQHVSGTVPQFVNHQNANFQPPFVNHQNANFQPPFVNHQNANFQPPFVNHQNMHFPNGNCRPRFF